MHQKLSSHDVQFLRYGMQGMDRDVWKKRHGEVAAPSKNAISL